MINCEELELDLPLLVDGALSDDRRDQIESHLPKCPLCREALDDYRAIKFGLARIGGDELPFDLANSIKASLSAELRPAPLATISSTTQTFSERMRHWLMPYSVGTMAACLFTIAFLFVMLSNVRDSVDVLEARDLRERSDGVMLATANSEDMLASELDDVPFALSPPEINPAGALVALTKSFVRGEMKDDEIVVVADVFGNGIARIAGVVDPPNNEADLIEIQKAFEAEPGEAPFMPSKVNSDDEKVRVVFRIHSVEVKSQK